MAWLAARGALDGARNQDRLELSCPDLQHGDGMMVLGTSRGLRRRRGPRRPTRRLPSATRPNRSNETMIIDCHGHYTTAPQELEAWRERQIAAIGDPVAGADARALDISDDEIRASLEDAQLKMQRERGNDLTLFSPRASCMAHHIGNATTSRDWSRVCNDLICRVCTLYPGQLRRRVPAAAVAGRAAGELHSRARALRQRTRLRRLQPQSGSVGRVLEGAAADRQLVVSALREDGRARRAGDGPRRARRATRASTRPARTTSTPTRRRSCSS